MINKVSSDKENGSKLVEVKLQLSGLFNSQKGNLVVYSIDLTN